jgi:hypothetical protein
MRNVIRHSLTELSGGSDLSFRFKFYALKLAKDPSNEVAALIDYLHNNRDLPNTTYLLLSNKENKKDIIELLSLIIKDVIIDQLKEFKEKNI